MAKLNTKKRDKLPDDAFALPGRRYPIYDKNHARAAMARADEMLKKGFLTKKERDIVFRKAKKVLGED